MKLKKITALCLCAVLLSGGVLAACGIASDDTASPDEATGVVTQVQTETRTEPQAEAQTETQAEPKTEAPSTTAPAATKPATKKPTKAPKPATEPATKAPAQNNSSSGNNQNTQQDKPVTCVITVNGKDHTVKLGDTVTYTYYLKTPKQIENVQATLNYPGTTLKLLDTVLVTDPDEASDSTKFNKELEGVFPVLKANAIYNASERNIIKFNASNISGMDFTQGGYLIKLRFEVISGISGGISTKIEYMDEVGGNPYVEDSQFSDNVKWEEKLTD